MFNLIRKNKINIENTLKNIKEEMEKSEWFKSNINKWLKESKYRDRFILNDLKELKSSGKYNELYIEFLTKKIEDLGYEIIQNEYMGSNIYNINDINYITDGKYSGIEIGYNNILERNKK